MAKPQIIRRLLPRPTRSFFLFGPRGTGKSTWLGQMFPKVLRLDLLDASLYLELARDPHHRTGRRRSQLLRRHNLRRRRQDNQGRHRDVQDVLLRHLRWRDNAR